MIRRSLPACLLVLVALSIPAFGSEAALDQPAPAALRIHFTTFHARLDALQHNFPLRVILPPGLAEFVAQIDAQEAHEDSFARPFLHEADYISDPNAGKTYRWFLDDTCSWLGLSWRYDAATDAVATDFRWRRDDPRSLAKLATAAQFTQPTGMFGGDPWIQREWGPLTLTENDEALRAFDALVSKPENFPRAWKLRFLEETRDLSARDFLWRGMLRDAAGQSRFVAIRNHRSRTTLAPPGSFACYVFDDQGHFLSGALLGDHYSAETPTVLLSRDRETLYLTRHDKIYAAINLASQGIALRPTSTVQGYWIGRALWRSR